MSSYPKSTKTGVSKNVKFVCMASKLMELGVGKERRELTSHPVKEWRSNSLHIMYYILVELASKTSLSCFQVFNVKQGWKPLCDFLGIPVPKDIPFPNVNDTKSINKFFTRIKVTAAAVVYGLPIALASLGYIFRESIASYLPF
jgi:hypothetical protein